LFGPHGCAMTEWLKLVDKGVVMNSSLVFRIVIGETRLVSRLISSRRVVYKGGYRNQFPSNHCNTLRGAVVGLCTESITLWNESLVQTLTDHNSFCSILVRIPSFFVCLPSTFFSRCQHLIPSRHWRKTLNLRTPATY
jgi:hypothetical protein